MSIKVSKRQGLGFSSTPRSCDSAGKFHCSTFDHTGVLSCTQNACFDTRIHVRIRSLTHLQTKISLVHTHATARNMQQAQVACCMLTHNALPSISASIPLSFHYSHILVLLVLQWPSSHPQLGVVLHSSINVGARTG